MDVTDVLKTSKSDGFDRESGPRPFQTMVPHSGFFAFCGMNPYG